jgi:hypothetical protein
MATAGERLAQADLFKAEGNEHFKVGKYKKALVSYGKCIAFAKCLPGTSLESATLHQYSFLIV